MASCSRLIAEYSNINTDEEETSSGWRRLRKGGIAAFVLATVGLVYYMGPLHYTARKSPGGADGRSNIISLSADTAVGGPAMQHLSQIAKTNLDELKNEQGSKSFIKDILFSSVEGKEMTAGLYRLDAGPALNYTYTYEEFKYVLEGEFLLTDGTGQEIVAKEGDLLYFPRGTNVKFDTPHTALGYYVGQRGPDEAAVLIDDAVRADIASKPKIVIHRQIKGKLGFLPPLPNNDDSNSFLEDIMVSEKKGKEMTTGFYLDLVGPTLHYTYGYEEFKLIVEGKFELEDGTGQKVTAMKGDLMYFPKGTAMKFSTPELALGLFCGQRKGGDA